VGIWGEAAEEVGAWGEVVAGQVVAGLVREVEDQVVGDQVGAGRD
jgi:hypothetical protein